MEILINIANILYVVAYFTVDMLRLRLLTTAAAICLSVYFYSQPEPLLNVVAWNLFFVSLNIMQIVRIVRARSAHSRANDAYETLSIAACRMNEVTSLKHSSSR